MESVRRMTSAEIVEDDPFVWYILNNRRTLFDAFSSSASLMHHSNKVSSQDFQTKIYAVSLVVQLDFF